METESEKLGILTWIGIIFGLALATFIILACNWDGIYVTTQNVDTELITCDITIYRGECDKPQDEEMYYNVTPEAAAILRDEYKQKWKNIRKVEKEKCRIYRRTSRLFK